MSQSNFTAHPEDSPTTGNTGLYSIIWICLDILLTIPTVFGNGLVICSVLTLRRVRGRSARYALIGNLAFSDLLVGAVLSPLDLLSETTSLNTQKYFCLTKLGVFILSLGGSSFSLMLISIERFAAVVFPLKSINFFTSRRLTLIITSGWAYVATVAALPSFGWNAYSQNQTACLSDEVWSAGYARFSELAFIGSLTANFVMYAVVMKIAIEKTKMRRLRGAMGVHLKSERDLQKVKTMVIVLGVFAICWLPYVVTCVILMFYDDPLVRFVRRCCLLPGLLNSAVNWIIYGYRNNHFRTAFKQILRCEQKQPSRQGVSRQQQQSTHCETGCDRVGGVNNNADTCRDRHVFTLQ